MQHPLTEASLQEMEEFCDAATPGPWHVRVLDDRNAMSLIALSTHSDTGKAERWPHFNHEEMITATLIQEPRYIDGRDEKWEENAAFIAMARTAIPQLISEIRALRETQ